MNGMDGQLIVRGTVLSQRAAVDAKGRPNGPPTIQLMKETARQTFELLNVKLYEGADAKKYEKGTHVDLSVDISVFEGTIYYRATRDAKEPKSAVAETRTPAPKDNGVKPQAS